MKELCREVMKGMWVSGSRVRRDRRDGQIAMRMNRNLQLTKVGMLGHLEGMPDI